ncbi:MAG: hypothetical protein FWF59_12485 [Turicibacter sp.]|nr:hypothetical protein [Turicibacter sp.]
MKIKLEQVKENIKPILATLVAAFALVFVLGSTTASASSNPQWRRVHRDINPVTQVVPNIVTYYQNGWSGTLHREAGTVDLGGSRFRFFFSGWVGR